MTDTIKIYHNPRCSKSRDTLNLLKSNGVEPEVVFIWIRPLTPPPCENCCVCWACPARAN